MGVSPSFFGPSQELWFNIEWKDCDIFSSIPGLPAWSFHGVKDVGFLPPPLFSRSFGSGARGSPKASGSAELAAGRQSLRKDIATLLWLEYQHYSSSTNSCEEQKNH
jgi:hypothetical protein